MPLRPVSVEKPFTQCGLDFVGMINPPSSAGHKWILTTTDYFTRWSEVVPLQNSSENEVLSFLEELTCQYGPPKIVISDNAHAFTGSWITQFTLSREDRHGIQKGVAPSPEECIMGRPHNTQADSEEFPVQAGIQERCIFSSVTGNLGVTVAKIYEYR
ncbi:uncharacterized protein LOC131876764 [Cryptomeria japonica]|uniref:uncharacterized protein LOC131876764 n=1 Tax=Cryptomeria japonica TaxID=3369 RepID=UPI0027DA7A31|nr:uncharacterized protein LOC131876764 [Cryptomeria japonica]